MKTTDVLAKVRTKQQMGELMTALTPNLNETGLAIADYIKESVSAKGGKDVTLASLKVDAKELLDEKEGDYFKKSPKFDKEVLFENSIKKIKNSKKKTDKTKDVEVTEEEAEALLNAIGKKDDKKDTKKEAKKDVTPDEIFELVGHRYTYPKFPEKFSSPEVLEGHRFEIVDSNNFDEIMKDFNDYQEGKTDYQFVCVMYFPDYERDYDIDPHYALGADVNKAQLLKTYGGVYPQSLDFQAILSFNKKTKSFVTVSELTGIPYVVSCSKRWFTTNEKLRCRVSQNGLDYQFYRVYPEKK